MKEKNKKVLKGLGYTTATIAALVGGKLGIDGIYTESDSGGIWEEIKPKQIKHRQIASKRIPASKIAERAIASRGIKAKGLKKPITFKFSSPKGKRVEDRDVDTKQVKEHTVEISGVSSPKVSTGRTVTVDRIVKSKDNKMSRKIGWLEDYRKELPALKSETIQLPEKFKAIAEVVVPKSSREYVNQAMELRYFKEQGYNTALLVWNGEEAERVLSLATYLKGKDWNIIWCHGPQESPDETRFADIQLMNSVLEAIAPYIDGVMPLWRKASLPHYDTSEAKKRIKIIGANAQKYGDIPVMGEYFWRLGGDNESAMPDNISGTVIQNAGHFKVIPDSILKNVNADNAIPVITGPPPYYTYRGKNQKYSMQEAWTLKQSVANNYLKAGARGVIVLSGDGAGERRGNTGQLTKTKWRKR